MGPGTTFALAILLLVLIGALLGTLVAPFAAFLAIPIVLFLLINIFMVGEVLYVQKRTTKLRAFRNSARAQKVDFTDEDKRTVIPT